MKKPLVLALPKGRVHEEAAALFRRAGYDLSASLGSSRKLIHDCKDLRVLVIRSQDVPTYVEYGAADLGIAGSDVLLEAGRDLYEPLDLRIAPCRMSVAEPHDRPVDERGQVHLRIATKYPSCTRKYLEERGLVAEVIKLYGSVELGPIIGLADRIVDLVSSGETLRQNGLREIEVIMNVTSRLVVNRASFKLRHDEIDTLLRRLRKVRPD
ncbi:MAG: ATP phosphoribosyltransferase [Deltaproteobacteria bacterium]|nr:ATP phosphoribosyltransferase [Deltaproteobacteria bacterium]